MCLFNEIILFQDENRSTFRNVFAKLRTLLPYMWPRKNPLLQFYVFISVLALLAGRVINLYVPIYNKNIGKLKYNYLNRSKNPNTFGFDLDLISP